ncbi:hypothetical protein CFT13S00388_02470 [Campylobacter fetus subsp. testudinum]|uniref:hypothetical protein n=1 Tax=Campylobacter fetus TaxID=196 RepID=UPI000818A217|nr:hypothetical protein [Campylobacter fetus]OCR88052.1 hypothetical protein CFT13S00388_02470 [Campylobacter fetus subsp. testudinum]
MNGLQNWWASFNNSLPTAVKDYGSLLGTNSLNNTFDANKVLGTSPISVPADKGLLDTLGGYFNSDGFKGLSTGVGAASDLYNTWNAFTANKENLKNIRLSRDIAMENQAMKRAEYDRLNRQRTNVANSYNS